MRSVRTAHRLVLAPPGGLDPDVAVRKDGVPELRPQLRTSTRRRRPRYRRAPRRRRRRSRATRAGCIRGGSARATGSPRPGRPRTRRTSAWSRWRGRTSSPAPISVAFGIAAPGLRTSARTTTYSAAIVSAAPGHSFIVVPSVARPIAAVMPIATAHAAAAQRSGRGRSANSSGASLIAKNPAIPAGTARTTEIARGSQPAFDHQEERQVQQRVVVRLQLRGRDVRRVGAVVVPPRPGGVVVVVLQVPVGVLPQAHRDASRRRRCTRRAARGRQGAPPACGWMPERWR